MKDLPRPIQNQQIKQTLVAPISIFNCTQGVLICVKAGADDVITKPFSAKDLIARVECHLKASQTRRSAAEKEKELNREVRETTTEFYKLLMRLNEGFTIWDDWNYVFVNSTMEMDASHHLAPGNKIVGKNVWATFLDIKSDIGVQMLEVKKTKIPRIVEHHYSAWDVYYEHRLYPLSWPRLLPTLQNVRRQNLKSINSMLQKHLKQIY